jgi:hypothetical protein
MIPPRTFIIACLTLICLGYIAGNIHGSYRAAIDWPQHERKVYGLRSAANE